MEPAAEKAALYPRIYLLPTRLAPEVRADLESRIPTLTSDINAAEVVVGRITSRDRALFELRRLNVTLAPQDEPAGKRPRMDSGSKDGQCNATEEHNPQKRIVRVAKLDWLTDSLAVGVPLPLGDNLLYQGIRTDPVPAAHPATTAAVTAAYPAVSLPVRPTAAVIQSGRKRPRPQTSTPPRSADSLPQVPSYVMAKYSCQRSTQAKHNNIAFVQQLRDVRSVRKLRQDKIGVRAYSTAIAAVAAYPHALKHPREIEALPGCSSRIAELFTEWQKTGKLSEAQLLYNDPELVCLREFAGIWGVGEATAREFYMRGWRDFDDIVEHGWNTLNRMQQVGLKYHDELQQRISRAESERIGRQVLEQANKLRAGFHMMLVGGYRKGHQDSLDVDVMLSHPDPSATLNAIEAIVDKLEEVGLVSHVLNVRAENSKRGQEPVPWRGNTTSMGTGFDTLDKAFLVWYDEEQQQQYNPSAVTSRDSTEALMSSTVPAPVHRRVDIIITPWRTKGCGVLGWSADPTFERDLRRYCKTELQLKFDGSGVRSRKDGRAVDIELDEGGNLPGDMEEAERRVFKSLGLEWRPPEERCTG